MARDKATKNGVKFTRESALAIAETVRAVQGSSRNQDGPRGSSNAQASSHYLSKTTAAWTKGTKQTLTLHVGEGGAEAGRRPAIRLTRGTTSPHCRAAYGW